MNNLNPLLTPDTCALVLLDHQAGLAFAVESQPRQTLLNNTISLVRTAVNYKLPVIVSTSASKVYSGPLMPPIQALIPGITSIERRNMNAWEDEAARAAIVATGRRKLLFSGLLTEGCVSFPVLSAMADGFDAYVVADTCGGATAATHELALRRMEHAGAHMMSWLQVLLELQRDWTRRETYAGARAIIEENGGGYGIGLRYAAQMLPPPPDAPTR
jgi:nicotinamidase-related amidase